MQITLTKAENPRYTIWRALNPAGRSLEFMAWIRSEWAACRKERGVVSDHPTGQQDEFTERLRDQVRVTAKGLARLAALLQAEAA